MQQYAARVGRPGALRRRCVIAITDQTRIAFIGGRGGRHSDSFPAFVPPGITLETVRLDRRSDSTADSGAAEDAYVHSVVSVLGEHRWDGASLVGTPTHVRFRGAVDRIRSQVKVPITSPLESGAAALVALGVRRALLLSPFDADLTQGVRDYFAAWSIDLALPSKNFATTEEAGLAGSEDVATLVRNELGVTGKVEAVLFQGARLDPLAVLDSLEQEIGMPLVASNPSMFWHVLAMLGQSYHIEGCGRLLREWPAPGVRP